jgi:hypothetical protein
MEWYRFFVYRMTLEDKEQLDYHEKTSKPLSQLASSLQKQWA